METLRMNLAPWQKRMIEDFIPAPIFKPIPLKEIVWIEFKREPFKCPASYKIPVHGLNRREWIMYFTDEQMNVVKDFLKLKIPISSVNITEEFLHAGTVAFGR
jgi:hypothetical protein